MTDKRIPKVGEVWTTGLDSSLTILNVYPDAVTYRFNDSAKPYAYTLETFVDNFTPPKPTVVDSRFLVEYRRQIDTTAPERMATHRLDLMSDGEFRVVKL